MAWPSKSGIDRAIAKGVSSVIRPLLRELTRDSSNIIGVDRDDAIGFYRNACIHGTHAEPGGQLCSQQGITADPYL